MWNYSSDSFVDRPAAKEFFGLLFEMLSDISRLHNC